MSYRTRTDSDDSELADLVQDLWQVSEVQATHSEDNNDKMDANQMRAIIDAALRIQAEESNRREQQIRAELEKKIEELSGRLEATRLVTPEVKVYKEAEIIPGRTCDEPMDAVKSLPDFLGTHDTYVAWRQAAHASYKIFKNYVGSSRHYQAVIIIRNKVKGPANAVLASFNTVLNFEAIIARLDFTYGDKRPIHVIEQEMGTLRQGQMGILEYYDEVEKKLTLLTNKVNMTYDKDLAKGMCEKFRGDALRVFISGLKRSLTDVLFAAHPADLPSALALAQEVEANHERYAFATSYARGQEEKLNRNESRNQSRHNYQSQEQKPNAQNNQGKSPAFKRQKWQQRSEAANPTTSNSSGGEPMDVDHSMSKFRQPTSFQKAQGSGRVNQNQGQAMKRSNTSERVSGQRRQRVDHVSAETDQDTTYSGKAEENVAEIEDGSDNEYEYDSANFLFDSVNFLGQSPCCRSFGEE